MADAHPDVVRMIAVNLSERSLGGVDAEAVLAVALDSSAAVHLPLMLALAPESVLPIDVQLDALRENDVITYCFRSHPWCLFPTAGPSPALQSAVARGVKLDVAHGSEAFDPQVARRAIGWGFLPDVVSSGIKAPERGHHEPIPLPAVMQRLHAAGMPLTKLLAAVTTTPAAMLGVDERIRASGSRITLDCGDSWTAKLDVVG